MRLGIGKNKREFMALDRVAQLAVDIVVNARRASMNLNRVRRDLHNTANSSNKLNKSLLGIGASAAIFLAVVQATRLLAASVSGVVGAYAQLEKQILDVQVVAQTKNVQQLADNFIRLGKALPGAEFQTISEVMQNAARLGIRGNAELAEFTRVATLLSQVAGDIAPADASRDLGTLLLNFDLGIEKAEALGSAINKLSDDYPVLTGEILKTSARLAGFAKAVGFSETELAALTTTLLKSRLSATTVRTSIVRLVTALQEEPLEVRDALKLTGEEINNLANLVDQGKPFQAIQEFIRLLGKLPATERFGALKELGLASSRVTQNISVLVDKQEDLVEVLDKVNIEYATNTNLLEKQQIVASQAASKLIDLGKAWELFKASFADGDFLNRAITQLRTILELLTPEGFRVPKVEIASTLEAVERERNIAISKRARLLKRSKEISDSSPFGINTALVGLRALINEQNRIIATTTKQLQSLINLQSKQLPPGFVEAGAMFGQGGGAENARVKRGLLKEELELIPKQIQANEKLIDSFIGLAGKSGQILNLRLEQARMAEGFADPAIRGALNTVFSEQIKDIKAEGRKPAQFMGLTDAWRKATIDANKKTKTVELLNAQKLLMEKANALADQNNQKHDREIKLLEKLGPQKVN